ncbi:putative membrane protein YdjX (TVP38/TMEM64 family) [Streptomyces sp. SAI-208]|uniref:TVP38/TMEM64 family protein n=1 Tax=unclassified Streptomyces TaxID=2593676 RepID=UPI00247372ED|nr:MULTISPECIES: TVP38/TMEM64 family protein [unclassified Streptomyces]MDH6520599.1 putative membrane protein YdjX (TVP38/TMEM64 family) [Streptomyces sp. SAI-090]MDH6552816.1 putative membrane protein YdjX (TVP38/TMEM64 family) [Streptomyces sp. SAI-041]MDH6571903.1 putative membrane protein YdjX (TVP38/TMEM64 family) [Streptomyces sp. SAI-117]MDH6583138.1 putative membrane protein YdjX (TVP38/TMEM64 family) [Streptomyces sp. SAI-133]MDH6611584.1 putative membrane protein YdjX (TVP38/TMEM64 
MLDATTRSGGTATATPPAIVTELALPAPAPVGLTARCTRVLLSPWSRLSLLVALLAGAASTVLLFEPQRLLSDGWPPQLGGIAAAVVFGVAYGLCTVAFVPRPLLNLAAGALFGSQLGLASALAGTVLGAGIAFGLGRVLGQDALRPLLRGRWLKAADGQLSRHGFRSMLAARLFPGVPFAAANYCAAVSRMGYVPFLTATALGSVPNTAAYVVAGARASAPTSPAFLIAMAAIALPGLAGAIVAWRKRHQLRRR